MRLLPAGRRRYGVVWESRLAERKQWGAQENLWPKFILKSAPLRATSSGLCLSIRRANRKLLKILDR